MSIKLLKCEKCGNVVLSVKEGCCIPSCCGSTMTELKANTVDASKEKHVPVIEHKNGKLFVKIGTVPHPMEENHYIDFLVFQGPCGATIVKHLKPGDEPVAFFPDHEHGTVYAYCNLHGLWKTDF